MQQDKILLDNILVAKSATYKGEFLSLENIIRKTEGRGEMLWIEMKPAVIGFVTSSVHCKSCKELKNMIECRVDEWRAIRAKNCYVAGVEFINAALNNFVQIYNGCSSCVPAPIPQ